MANPKSNLALRKFFIYGFAALSPMVCEFVLARVFEVSKFEIPEARVSSFIWTRSIDGKCINW
jgi:hypothetical protein